MADVVDESAAAAPAATPPPPKARTSDDEFEDAIKKTGGLKYKASGKEKSVTSVADLRRLLSRVDGTDAARDEALKRTQHADGIVSKVEALKKMKPLDRARALAEIVGDERLVEEAFEDYFLSKADKEKQAAGMTPRERELADALEKRDGELASFRQRQEQTDEEQRLQAQVAKVNQISTRLGDIAGAALMKCKIDKTHAPMFLPAIARELDRSETLKLGLDEHDIAETVMKEHGSLARGYYEGLDVDAHMDELRQMQVPDPQNPGKTTSKWKLMILKEAALIRAQRDGSAPPPTRVVNGAPQQQNGAEETREQKMAAARTFGGGWR